MKGGNNMPFVSQDQAKWAFATKQPFAKEFAAKTKSISALPKKVKPSTTNYSPVAVKMASLMKGGK